MDSQGMTGAVALVTGAGSGLGEATAHALGAAGCTVACLDLRGDAAGRVAAAREAAGGRAAAWQCDVTQADAVFATVESAVQRFGRLDIVANCAGTDHVLPIDSLTVAQWDQIIGVNLRAAFLTAKASFPVMRRQHSGHIVNIASTAATRAWANAAAYHASKWGLVGFSRALGVEGRPHGIRSTTVIPGGMRTHFFDRFPEQGIPLPDERNLQDPANVAQLILFAVQVPPESALQEVIFTPLTETSWP